MMKLGTATVAVLLATATSANAMDWTGFYFGGETGHSWLSSFSDMTRTTTDMETWSIGLTGGYMWGVGSAVVGIEAKAGSYSDGVNGPIPASVTSYHITRLYGSVSAKAGFPYDRFLPYVSAGLQATMVDIGVTDTNPILSATSYGAGILPTAAVGVEFALTDTVRLKTEFSTVFGGVHVEQDNGATSDFRQNGTLVVGLNIGF